MLRKLGSLLTLAAVFTPNAMAFSDEMPWFGEHKIIGKNNLEPIAKATGEIYDWSKGVAIFEVERFGEFSGMCTASRVDENLFLTNAHCELPGMDNKVT